MSEKNKKTVNLIRTLRRLIVECVKEAPNLREVEKITGEKYPDIKKKPFWQNMSHDIKPDASDHLKATHLAVLSIELRIDELFGHAIVFHEEILRHGHKDPVDKEIFGLCDSLRKLHESQKGVEMKKLSLVQ